MKSPRQKNLEQKREQKPWTSTKGDRPRAAKYLEEGHIRVSAQVRQLKRENEQLTALIDGLNESLMARRPSEGLIAIFKDKFTQYNKSLKERKTKTALLRELLKQGRFETNTAPSSSERATVLAENAALINAARLNERNLVAQRLQLQELKDQTCLLRLRASLDKIMAHDFTPLDDEPMIQKNQEIIQRLKNAIAYEKRRYQMLLIPKSPEDKAAIVIQRVWRGYNTRH